MAPTAVSIESQEAVPLRSKTVSRVGLESTGSLDKFDWDDLTPAIGREFAETNIVNDLLNAPDADQLLRDLAITISQRGVVFFRKQDNLTNDLQKELVHRLGQVRVG